MALMLLGMTSFNVLPIYKSIQAGAFTTRDIDRDNVEFAVYFAIPGIDCYDYFYILTALNVYFSYITACSICVLDLLLSLIVFQIIGHIQILNYNILNIPMPEGLKYNKEENSVIGKHLISIIDQHRYIVRLVGFSAIEIS